MLEMENYTPKGHIAHLSHICQIKIEKITASVPLSTRFYYARNEQ